MRIYYLSAKRHLKKIEDRKIREDIKRERWIRLNKAPDGGNVFPMIIATHRGKYTMLSVSANPGVEEGVEVTNDLIKKLGLDEVSE
jgi:hypothetical protein